MNAEITFFNVAFRRFGSANAKKTAKQPSF